MGKRIKPEEKMNYFIVGINGYIAGNLFKTLEDRKNIKYTSSSRQNEKNCYYLDLAESEKFDYNVINENDYIICLASVSSPDICDRQYDFAYKVNVSGTKYFIKKCLEKNARVLFMASDTVYGASRNNDVFLENSDCNPVGSYGIMKHSVEKEFLPENNFKSFRLSYVFSKEDKFTSYLAGCSEKKVRADIFHPVYRNAVYLKDVIQAIINLEKKWNDFDNKVFNLCGKQLLSRIDLAKIYKNTVDKNLDINIIQPEDGFFKARPQIINMESLYLAKLLERNPYTIEQAMQIEFNQSKRK